MEKAKPTRAPKVPPSSVRHLQKQISYYVVKSPEPPKVVNQLLDTDGSCQRALTDMYSSILQNPNEEVKRSKAGYYRQPLDLSECHAVHTGFHVQTTLDSRPIEFAKNAAENVYMGLWRYFGGNTSPTELEPFTQFVQDFMAAHLTEPFHQFEAEPFHCYPERQFAEDVAKCNRYQKSIHA